jgi:hypothetical protein
MTWRPRTKARPSAIERRPGRWPGAPAGGCGEIRNAGHQHLGRHQQATAVHGVDHRSAQQRPGDQREELGQRDQANVEGRVGQLVHLVRHRHRGQLGAEHRDELTGDQAAQIA